MDECWENDIITVIAAGDNADYQDMKPGPDGKRALDTHSLDKFAPQEYGSPGNVMITVGGVDAAGRLIPSTTFDAGKQLGGSISVYALADYVIGADDDSPDGSEPLPGTSQATAQVSGLAAYFASLRSLDELLPEGKVAGSMKGLIIRYAYQRIANSVPGDWPEAPAPESIIVAYNGAYAGLCSSDAGQPPQLMGRGVNATTLARRRDTSEVDVKVDGDVVDASWSKSYCATSTSAKTSSSPAPSTTGPSSAHEPSPTSEESTEMIDAPAPAINMFQGIHTCGTRTHAEDGELYFFSLEEIHDARMAFCRMIRDERPYIRFEPGEGREHYEKIYRPPNAERRAVNVSVEWVSGPDSICEPLEFTRMDWYGDQHLCDGYEICKERVDVPIHNCDIRQGGHALWKQGGKFFRNCVTWEVTAVDPEE